MDFVRITRLPCSHVSVSRDTATLQCHVTVASDKRPKQQRPSSFKANVLNLLEQTSQIVHGGSELGDGNGFPV